MLRTTVMWTATMKNFSAKGDMVRRALACRLDAKTERPEERVFTIKDLPQYLRDNREKLVTAALTILRAYHVAGSPRQNVTPWGSFDQWSRKIREPIVWLGLPDPWTTREFIVEADSDRDALGTVLTAWVDVFGAQETNVADVIAEVERKPTEDELQKPERIARLDALAQGVAPGRRRLGRARSYRPAPAWQMAHEPGRNC
jgi:putative DNA primase/helicase